MIRRYKKMRRRSIFWALKAELTGRRFAKKDLNRSKAYEIITPFLREYHKRLKVNIKSFGGENLNSDLKGCVLMGNHQAMGDCQVVIQALKDYDFETSFIINHDKKDDFLIKHIIKMMKAKTIDFNNLRQQLKVYNEMTNEIKNGQRYVIFPEAGYNDNKNTLLEFNTPCFVPAIKSNCPIIPFVLYDTWRIFNDDTLNWVDVECHILKPIYYEEYKDLSKQELACLVKQRIKDKLNEIEAIKCIK